MDRLPMPTGDLRVRNVSSAYWVGLVPMLGIAALSVGLLIGGAAKHRTAPLVTGLILSIFAIPMVILFLTMFRPFVVTQDVIRIPAGFRTRVLSLDVVTGVGLLYRHTPNSRAPEGWFLEIWDSDGRRYQVGKVLVTSWTLPTPPGEKRPIIGLRANRPKDWPLPNEDPSVLAESRAGRIARDIYERVLASQGPAGPLAQQAREKHESYNRWAVTETLAWWSPDGSMGRIGPYSTTK